MSPSSTPSQAVVCVLVYRASEASESDPELVRRACERLGRLYPDRPVYVGGPGADDWVAGDPAIGATLRSATGENLFACLSAALEECGSADQDSAAIFRDWAPLVDGALADEMAIDHFRYLAHYTYCDNVPVGLLPDLASLEFVRAVPLQEIGDTDLREFVFKNVNRFDVEIFYRLPDLRQYRLDLSTASARSRTTAARIHELAPDCGFADLESLVRQYPDLIRGFPSWIEIELSRSAPSQPVFLPRAEDFAAEPAPTERPAGGSIEGTHLDEELVAKLLDELERDSLGDVSIALGGIGEPLRHPGADGIIARLLAHDAVTSVYLETYGVDLAFERARALSRLSGASKLVIIFRLATLRAERYLELYGSNDLEIVLENIAAIEARDSIDLRIYAEMPRLAANADEIEAYFERFENSPVSVILGKYNNYAGRLPERRAADLTPLHRDFCWHLARDLSLNADGRVPLCKQDPFARAGGSDFRDASIADILETTRESHAASVRGEHDKIPMPCLACDEWYTFNG